jgi:hypothetical protein
MVTHHESYQGVDRISETVKSLDIIGEWPPVPEDIQIVVAMLVCPCSLWKVFGGWEENNKDKVENYPKKIH